jgi:hypothetical protein
MSHYGSDDYFQGVDDLDILKIAAKYDTVRDIVEHVSDREEFGSEVSDDDVLRLLAEVEVPSERLSQISLEDDKPVSLRLHRNPRGPRKPRSHKLGEWDSDLSGYENGRKMLHHQVALNNRRRKYKEDQFVPPLVRQDAFIEMRRGAQAKLLDFYDRM